MKQLRSIIYLLILLSICSCKKFLEAKPDEKLSLFSTISDLQKLMDAYNTMNILYPFASEIQGDNYFMTEANWNALLNDNWRNVYTWVKDDREIQLGTNLGYASSFKPIVQANVVIDESKNINFPSDQQLDFNNALGSAYFFRGYYYAALSELYIKPYNKVTASADLGLPLRNNPDFNTLSVRSSVEETYQFIISDLKRSVNLLPVVPLVKSRPSKPAAYGALARIFLYINDFENAKIYADSCLALYSELIDFNTLNKSATAPFARFNKEVIFHIRSTNSGLSASPLRPTRAIIDPVLYASYAAKDLRKFLFFRLISGTNYAFKGDYDGQGANNSGYVFGGVVTDEVFLIRAEAKARTGDINGAMKDLNKLLETRWETGSFTPYIATTVPEAITLIIQERRKELVYRGTRWSDIRRLTGTHQIIPKRTLGNKTYILEAGSLRYAMAIPLEEIQRTGMPQNP